MNLKNLIAHTYSADDFPADDVPDGDVLAPHHAYIGLALTLFGFLFVWPYYPQTGAALSLLGILVTADDVLEHAFGIWTPLDALWKRVLVRFVR